MKYILKSKQSIWLYILVALSYVICFDFLWHNYIEELFRKYSVFNYTEIGGSTRILYYVITVFPILFFKGTTNISSLFSIFVWLLAYVPFMEALFTNFRGQFYAYMFIFLISMVVFFKTDNKYLFKHLALIKISKKISFNLFEIICWLTLLLIFIINFSKIQFVNFFDNSELMYEMRASNKYGSIEVYIICWLKNVLFPVILCHSLWKNNIYKVILSVVGFIILFILDMQKITALIPFVIIAVYYTFKDRTKNTFTRWFFPLMCIGFISFSLLLYTFLDTPICYTLAAILIMRTMAIEGMELGTYLNFFEISSNPVTFYSHINFVNAITNSYPYVNSIGITVTGNNGNANGCFWLMDGIAAGNEIGCIIVSLLFILVKCTFNSLSLKYDMRIIAPVLLFMIANVMNVSLFTALFTGGIILFYVCSLFVDFSFMKKK